MGARTWSTLMGGALLAVSACAASTERPTEQADVVAASGEVVDGAGTTSSDNPFRIGRPLVIPHAGGDGMFPENTIQAYERSMEMGGDVVDVDVRIAADGVLVAFHDSTLDRTTDATGPMNALTSTELGRLDAAYDFEIDGEFPYRGQGIGVPTVEDVLVRFPDSLVTLDLKEPGPAPVGPVCDLLRRLDRTDVYVGTETDDQTPEFRARCPEVATSGTSEERAARRAALEAGETASPVAQLVSQPPYLNRDGERHITREYLDFLHAGDTAVLTWVIDDRETMTEMIEMGIDGIYTRRPDVMLEVLGELGYI